MKDKDFISNAEKIRELSKAYPKDDGKSKGLFGGKKKTVDKINDFGTNQNRFNSNVCRALEDTNSTFEELCNKINTLETKLASVVQQNDALKSRINVLQKNDLMVIDSCIKSSLDNTNLINNYIRKINPNLRNNVNYDGRKEISVTTLSDALSFAKGKDLKDIDFNSWSTSYKNTLRTELHNISLKGTKNIITVVCKGAIKSLDNTSVKNPAFDIYKILKKSSIYNIKFISIEDIDHPIFDGDFICVPSKNTGTYISVIEPSVCVFSDLNILKENPQLLTLKSILNITTKDTLENIDTDLLQELCYFNDLELHKYLVNSKDTNDILIEKGLHSATIYNENSIVDFVETFLEKSTIKNVLTLKAWKETLQKKNKSLVLSNEDIIKYHENHDFNTNTSKIFDFMELQNVSLILEDRFDNNKNLNILDISCGNGRITQECLVYGKCTSIDTNTQLISDSVKNANVSKLDYVTQDIDGTFDAITCFRYIHHFDYATRKIIYKKILSNLKNSGILIMDIPSTIFENSTKKDWQNCVLYQKTWTKESLIEELKENGFMARYIIPTGEDLSNPTTWTVGALRI